MPAWTATARWRRTWARKGCSLELALRPGVQHSASETTFNFERVIPMAQRLSATGPKRPILLREDSGFDSAAQMRAIESYNRAGQPQLDFLIKWNPRSTDVSEVAAQREADVNTRWEHPREGKRVTVWEQALRIEGIDRPLRRVLRLIERTIDARGQLLIAPQLVLDDTERLKEAGEIDPCKHPEAVKAIGNRLALSCFAAVFRSYEFRERRS